MSGGAATATTGQVLQYTVTGINASKVDIVLADADQVSTNSSTAS